MRRLPPRTRPVSLHNRLELYLESPLSVCWCVDQPRAMTRGMNSPHVIHRRLSLLLTCLMATGFVQFVSKTPSLAAEGDEATPVLLALDGVRIDEGRRRDRDHQDRRSSSCGPRRHRGRSRGHAPRSTRILATGFRARIRQLLAKIRSWSRPLALITGRYVLVCRWSRGGGRNSNRLIPQRGERRSGRVRWLGGSRERRS